ncbi:MAG TPA: class I SAM-dependent methyltransferase [Pirellula sp.]|nr:class I SAM-dependent methyltransferase [Pirellula sp.]
MGFLKEKYTREYFTGRNATGVDIGYGALGANEWRAGNIFQEIREPIDSVDLRNARVFEIGYGRGESARYMFKTKGIIEYFGVDFSEAANHLARETLADIPATLWRLEVADALPFMQAVQFKSRFDVVFMLDTIEHIPRAEVECLLPLIMQALKTGGQLIVDTPFYGLDEDYIDQGYRFIAPSASDLHPATMGMHCNKFTRERILRVMSNAGFKIMSDKNFQKPSSPQFQKTINWLRRSTRVNSILTR